MDSIEAGPVTLRQLGSGDIADITAGCNNALVQRFLPQLPRPYTEADARFFVGEYAPAQWAAGGAQFAIADPLTDRLLGCVGVHPRGRGAGEIGYWVAPWGRGRRAAANAARAVSAWAFEQGYARLEIRTELANSPSQRVAIAAGYAREGVQRGGGQGRGGTRYDLITWGRLATDPPGPTPRLLPDLPGGELSDGTVTLRPIGVEDTEDVLRTHQLPEVVAAQMPPEPFTPERAARRCAHAESNWLAGAQATLSIRDAVTDAFAGEIGLYYAEPPTGQAMIGYDLDPAWRGRGYASRAVRLLTAWAFERTGIARIIAGTAPENIASQRVLEAAGFRREGYQRSRLPGVSGARIDDLLYALLPDDPVVTPTRTPWQ
ncbi:GNAT family N-acetyltransferase [Planosporangium flavigriseum]|nr:GNAT family N-acetyltransferase [Planosporangium flavigriseum]NJC64956.1 GNAT family N-acetyltransferase [Planosporangium flavigriseum]